MQQDSKHATMLKACNKTPSMQQDSKHATRLQACNKPPSMQQGFVKACNKAQSMQQSSKGTKNGSILARLYLVNGCQLAMIS
jgi:hypothetical protein